MKKMKILFVFVLTLLPLAGLLGQVGGWQDLYENYPVFFATSGGVAAIAMFLGELVIRVLKLAVKWQKIAVIWVIAIVASLAGNFILNVGYLGEATLLETVIWGLFSGLVANGIWSSNIAFVKTFLEFVLKYIKAKPEVEVPVAE